MTDSTGKLTIPQIKKLLNEKSISFRGVTRKADLLKLLTTKSSKTKEKSQTVVQIKAELKKNKIPFKSNMKKNQLLTLLHQRLLSSEGKVDINILPRDSLRAILLKSSFDDIKHLCLLNKTFLSICNEDYFWMELLKRDYESEYQSFDSVFPSNKKLVYLLLHSLSQLKRELPAQLQYYSLDQIYQLRKLNLSENKLKKLPKEIGILSNLQQLNLRNNQLLQLPDTFGNLSNLKDLDLSFNKLKELPDSIGNLSELQLLSLYHNQLLQLPHTIGNLSNLDTLYLGDNNQLQIPDTIGNLSKLSLFYLDENQYKKIPKAIKKKLRSYGTEIIRKYR